MKKPFVVAISGVAGSGKDSILEKLWQMPELFEIVVSYTDRPPRPGEIKDKNYHFISPAEFDRGIKAGEFIEWEAVRGETRYGRKKADFDQAFKSGKTVVFVAEVLGVQKFKKIFDLATIFIVPPSKEVGIERLKKRGNDTPEGLKQRIDRYNFEMSFKHKYDHVVINDDLAVAQKETIEIIAREKAKREHKAKLSKILPIFLLAFIIIDLFYLSAYAARLRNKQSQSISPVEISLDNPKTGDENVPAVAVPATPPTTEIKKKIAATPPKKPTTKLAESTTTNANGSTTTAVSTGGSISSADLAKISNSTGTINTPLDVTYSDETGKYAGLGATLENYLNSALKWRNEISALKNITVRNAGATGWEGQYLGSYTSSGGKISSASGSIILNTYYIETQHCTPSNTFTNCESEYAKLVLSHEYGHHYTLWHKWMDWNLPNGTRFPDSYYTTRPLSKSSTATDYSLGWSNCEVEIIAEDYSYLYSGYGLQAMHTGYGYPSAATKTWLDNIGSSSELNPVSLPAPVANLAPTVAISSPANGATVSGVVDFSVNATDDNSVANVSFYVATQLISTDTTAPYSAQINTTGYANGIYVLKAIGFDGTLTTEKTITVNFENTTTDLIKPEISLVLPTTNPYSLSGNSLTVKVVATDNVAVDKIELYFNDTFQKSWSQSSLSLSVSFSGIPAGTHNLKFRAYDKAGNYQDVILIVNKT